MSYKHSIIIVIISVFLSAATVHSADVMLIPSVNVKGEYNDNIDFSRTNKLDDYTGIVSPALTLNYATDRLNMNARTAFDIIGYADYTDRNRQNQNHKLGAGYKLSERFSVNADGLYTKDTTLDTELQETGLVKIRTDREFMRAGGGFSYQLSEVSGTALDYFFTRTDYDHMAFTDSKGHSVSLSYNHSFNNRIDILTLKSSCRKNDSDEDKVYTYSFSVGLDHTFSPALRGSASAGVRYSDTEESTGRSETDWGWTSDISLKRSWETVTAEFTYLRDLDYSAEGEAVEVNRFSLAVDKMVTVKFGIKLSGSLYFTKSAGDIKEENTRYYSIIPSLYYKITQNHSVELGYSYSNEYDKLLADNREVDRNIVWLLLSFSFPQKL
jgi:opacity protein-like surface antigen